MKFNCQNDKPEFRILTEKKIKDLYSAALQILERTGSAFECQEALDLLGDAGADVTDPAKVKIPARLVEQAMAEAPKMITIYSRDGDPVMVLDGRGGSHFGVQVDSMSYLDPYTRKRRPFEVRDVIDHIRITDALENIEWFFTCPGYSVVPGVLAEKISVLQCTLNSTKPIVAEILTVPGLRGMIETCAMIAGGEDQLRKKPFLIGSAEPVTPLLQGKEAMEKGLICAEKGIPHVVYGMPMLGATTPATLAGCLAIALAEVLAELVVLQLKNPGTPVIGGTLASVMDMKSTIFSFGAPEMSLMVGAMTEIYHYFGLPSFGTAGCTDAAIVGAQAGVEATYQVMLSALTGADLVHDTGIIYHDKMVSPELTVLVNEIIGMVNVTIQGVEVNSDTLALDLIEKIGPKGSYIAEQHTFDHFRDFWPAKLFDRSYEQDQGVANCEDQVRQKTIEILENHEPKPLEAKMVAELKKLEKSWFDAEGLKYEYPKADK
ncbi:MAG: hypothetical protein B6I22_11300 [Desulfobacteraceae bacterium 4572_123]|nr:MAG: hypothetical protein B6I22_11300 [Desulfobacteraceae bacterium 4572_123]